MTGPEQDQPNRAPRHAAVPIDFTAALAAMQDQIDDLTATVTLLHERLDPGENGLHPDGHGPDSTSARRDGR